MSVIEEVQRSRQEAEELVVVLRHRVSARLAAHHPHGVGCWEHEDDFRPCVTPPAAVEGAWFPAVSVRRGGVRFDG